MESTSILSPQDLEPHIFNLQAQCHFLTKTLEATQASTPSWLAKDILMLRNQTSSLQASMEKLRRQLARSDGFSPNSADQAPNFSGKNTDSPLIAQKRESLASESPRPRKRRSLTNGEQVHISDESSDSEQDHDEPHFPNQNPQDTEGAENEPIIEYEDISAEVEQRLRVKRLEELMSIPLKAKKRKREEMEDEDKAVSGDEQGADDTAPTPQESSPPKKLKYFVQTEKRKEQIGQDRHDPSNDRPQKKVKSNLEPPMRRVGNTNRSGPGMGNGDARKRVRR